MRFLRATLSQDDFSTRDFLGTMHKDGTYKTKPFISDPSTSDLTRNARNNRHMAQLEGCISNGYLYEYRTYTPNCTGIL